MEEQEEKYLFEEMPVPKAVATLAVPTIIVQVVTMIYNLADTFFVGQLGDPAMVAAVSLGCMGFSHAYGAPTESGEAVRLLRRAAEMGYTFFDTAEVHLPDEGITGNDHFMFQDLNNDVIADHIENWIRQNVQ